MIPLDPLPNLIDQVYARILEAITDRTLPPGQRIRQNELAEKLGVSRQPVSHALHLLHRQGLVAESGRRGFEVTQLDPVAHPPALRGARRHRCAGRAAGRRTRQDATRPGARGWKQRCTPDARSTARRRCRQLIALDVDFHRAIYQLAGNPAIEETIAPQWPHMRRSMATVLAELDYRDSAWAEHETIAATHSRRRRESRRERGAGACADGGTNDRGEIEGDGRGGGSDTRRRSGLVAGIHALRNVSKDVDGRVKLAMTRKTMKQRRNDP